MILASGRVHLPAQITTNRSLRIHIKFIVRANNEKNKRVASSSLSALMLSGDPHEHAIYKYDTIEVIPYSTQLSSSTHLGPAHKSVNGHSNQQDGALNHFRHIRPLAH